MGMQVLDLNAGLGGRVYAFEKAGFEIAAVVESNVGNCEIMASWMPSDRIFNINLVEVNPDDLPETDIITAKYVIQNFSVISKQTKDDISKDENVAILNIIENKNPRIFMLEVPTIAISAKRHSLEEYIQKFYEIGYKVSYAVYDEASFSGYPVLGRQGYIVGCKYGEDLSYIFPEPTYENWKRELEYDSPKNIHPYYRKLNFQTDDWEKGYVYSRAYGKLTKSQYIRMGYARESYFIDEVGPRRFTHNELATLKGLYSYNYNEIKNKARTYIKIANASNVYTVEALAKEIKYYIDNSDKQTSKVIFEDVNRQENKSEETELKKEKIEKPEQKKILFPRYFLKEIKIQKLKGINDLTLKFDKNVVALMGVNGSGKSTILHALACIYKPYEKGEDNKFSYFFTPTPDASWAGSCFTIVNYDFSENKSSSKKYEKQGSRWIRYDSRPARDVYFLGISSCIPEIEREKKTSFINYTSKALNDKLTKKVIVKASSILNKGYEELMLHETGKKVYIGVHTKDGKAYSALSMGAGEQRIFKILQTVYAANQYSLILIDEIDLLLHADAFHKLIIEISEIAKKKNLQIIFTTHSLEMQHLNEYADIRYIERENDRMLVYDSIKPDLLYKMSGEMKRKYSIYVEDDLAISIVRQIAMDLNMQRHISIISYGSIENAFTVAAGKVLSGENVDNILIVTDGDRFITTDEKRKRVKTVLTGTEKDHDEKIEQALKMIVQFNLPENTSPEKYIHSMLSSMNDSRECIVCAKNITSVSDSHEWLGKIEEQMGIGKVIYGTIMNIVSEHELWETYVSSVYEWIKKKKDEVELKSIDRS